jgi:biotin-dependent carboxylase-like uncharacterized protein
MRGLKILKPGLLTSLQDLGRPGLGHFAIPIGGVMDRNSVILSNRLLGNPDHCPVIECTLIGGIFEVLSRIKIAITGADMKWRVNGYPLQLNRCYVLERGDILEGGRAIEGFRSYIGIEGRWIGQTVYGSVSYLSYAAIGNLDGSPLRSGDILEFAETEKSDATIPEPTPFLKAIPLQKGPEFDDLDAASQKHIFEHAFYINAQSNRMGARLEGPPLKLNRILKESVPLLPGFIQLPPSGKPIVILQDGQCTGGYPRIAYIDREELDILNQVPIGSFIQFEWAD